MNSTDLQLRIKNLALRTVPLCEALPNNRIGKIVEDPLLKSSFSAAANYLSACNAQLKKAFIAKLSIALEEGDEAQLWLEMIQELKLIKPDKLNLLLQETNELTKFLGASGQTAFKQLTIKNKIS